MQFGDLIARSQERMQKHNASRSYNEFSQYDRQHRQIAGTPLEPLLPFCEERSSQETPGKLGKNRDITMLYRETVMVIT